MFVHKHFGGGQSVRLEIISDTAGEVGLLGVPSMTALVMQRLYARRWLITTAAATLFVFHLAFDLPATAMLGGIGVITAAAAILPREGLIRVTRIPASADSARGYAETVLSNLMEGLPEPAIVLTSSGSVLHFNRQAAGAFEGLKTSRHISGIIRHPQLLDAVAKAAADQPSQTVIYRERVPVERQMAATVSWIGGNDRPAVDAPAIMIFLRDVTGEERLDETRADFIAYASHELKTPLASLIGFIETLKGPARNDPEARERFLTIMLQQAGRMSRLIENLLSLSRVEMHVHLRPQTPVDLSEVVGHAVQTLELMAAEKGISIEAEGLGNPAFVLGDRDELTQLFQNLIHNAIKYGRQDGYVRVKIEKLKKDGAAAGSFAISVADDGIGIAPQHLPRLTERFYRVNDGAADGKTGTGLGLAIVKQVISRHRGELKISSQPGKGSAFTVILTETEAL